MRKAQISEQGEITLPPELAGWFGADRECSVSEQRSHLELWRLWSERHPPPAADRKVSRKGIFLEAGRRALNAARSLRNVVPEVAVYLAGYAVECGLKYAICTRYQVNDLIAAQERLERESGENLALLGSDGHNLALLWECSGFVIQNAEAKVQEAVSATNQWDVAWRYQVPSQHRRSTEAFIEAVEALWPSLEGVG